MSTRPGTRGHELQGLCHLSTVCIDVRWAWALASLLLAPWVSRSVTRTRQSLPTPRRRLLRQDIDAHGIGCSRIYPSRLGTWADHDAAACQVGSASLTLHVWKGVSPPINVGEASRHVAWVVGPNWLVATTNRFAAVQVAMVIGGDLIPEEIP